MGPRQLVVALLLAVLPALGAAIAESARAADVSAEDLAFDPPPISLHVKNADGAALEAALSKALGLPVGAYLSPEQTFSKATPAGVSFTLDADNEPFWDVYAKLSQQHLLRLGAPQEQSTSSSLYRLKNYQRFGPFVVYQMNTELSRSRNYQASGSEGTKVSYQATFAVVADPRLKIAQDVAPFLKSVTDEAGQIIWERKTPLPPGARTSPVYDAIDLPYPPKAGQKLFVIGEFKAVVEVSTIKRVIDDVPKHAQESFEIGPFAVTLDALSMAEGLPPTFMANFARRTAGPPQYITYSFTDGEGKVISPGVSMRGSFPIGDTALSTQLQCRGTGPFRLTVSTPDKVREKVFQFKLPLATE